MCSNQQVDVCLDHPNLENVRSFLARNASQETAQELSEAGIDEVRSLAGRPDDVVVETVPQMPSRGFSREI